MRGKAGKLSEDEMDILLEISSDSIAPALEILKSDLKSNAEQYLANSERIEKGLELYAPVSTQLNFLPNINLVTQRILSESQKIQAETAQRMLENEKELEASMKANKLALEGFS